jgi:hypothetical protein
MRGSAEAGRDRGTRGESAGCQSLSLPWNIFHQKFHSDMAIIISIEKNNLVNSILMINSILRKNH